jgi:hypothetical protein
MLFIEAILCQPWWFLQLGIANIRAQEEIPAAISGGPGFQRSEETIVKTFLRQTGSP